VRKHFRKASVVENSTRFREDLGADSLDLIELIYEFEQDFGVAIDDAEAVKFRTIGDAVRHVEGSSP
jgi:acyl carrier protein